MNQFQPIFDKQKDYFNTDATKSYEWRIEQLFRPLLPILAYKDIDAAILEVKKRPRPLSGLLFSRDQKAIDHFLASLSFGGGAINQVNRHNSGY